MNQEELHTIFNNLIQSSENEIIEFKEAKSGYDFTKIGTYFSAISNEANLKNQDFGWLIFGVEDKNRVIVGTQYRPDRKSLDSLKKEIADKTTSRISFLEIYEIKIEGKRVILFQIPAATKGIPTAFEGHYYGRKGESLDALDIDKIERIRRQIENEDWSAKIIPEATLDDLDVDAIYIAKRNFKEKFPEKAEEMERENWDTITFLNKAKITIKGKITRTALILLGKEESEHFLSPADVKIRWKLIDSENNDIDYELFGIPLLLSVEKVYAKIRNIKYRYMQQGTIFPAEVSQYEPFSIREAINNCIAHQDYTKNARINVIEKPDELIFTNHGDFIPESIEKVIFDDAPEEVYKNRFLATAMFNLKMVDTAGGGIKKIFKHQRDRFFPMPDYDLSNHKVQLSILGKVLDLDYARLLAQNKNLSLNDIMMLDKVQKGIKLTDTEEKKLKKKYLIEGRKPNYFISKNLAQKIGKKAEYSKNKGFDKKYYLDLILKAITEHKEMTRKEIDDLLWEKLPDILDEKQKKSKIGNLISELRIQNKIENNGIPSQPKWVLKTLS